MTVPLDALLRATAYELDPFKPTQINALRRLGIGGDDALEISEQTGT